MKSILNRLCFVLALMSFQSCVRGSIEIDSFQAKLEIMTSEISDEGTFVFRVHTSSNKIRLDAYNCEFRNDNAYPVGGVFSITSADYVEFRIEDVVIKETHVGKLALTVSDPDSGKKYELSDTYIAKQKAFVNASISSSVLKSSSKLSGNTYPTVIEGDDVELIFSTTFKRLVLTDFACEIDTEGFLQRGMILDFDERGEWRHVFKKVKVEKDNYTSPIKMNFTFRAPSALDGSSIEATPVEYITVTLPKLNIETPSEIWNSGPLRVRLTGNREQFGISMIECSKYSVVEDLSNFNEISGDAIQFYFNGYCWANTLTTKVPIEALRTETVPFSITFKDIELTNRYLTLSSQFSVHRD